LNHIPVTHHKILIDKKNFDEETISTKETFEQKDSESESQKIKQWLQQIEMSQYFQILIENGFDRMSSIQEIDIEDLAALNVKLGHRKLIMKSINRLIND